LRYNITVSDVTYILGIHVQCDRVNRTIHLLQTALIEKVIEQFSQEHAAHSVLASNCPVTDGDKRTVDGKRYMELIGSLQYIAQGTRPDIAHATSRLATVLNNPGAIHYRMALRVVRYLAAMRDYGLVLGGPNDSITILGMTESGYATCPTSCRSVSGYAFSLRHGAVLWSSQKQDIVATSTCEAK
jgi:hypothetical protein